MESKKQLVIKETVNRIFVIQYGENRNSLRLTSYCTEERAQKHALYLRKEMKYKYVEITEINLWME